MSHLPPGLAWALSLPGDSQEAQCGEDGPLRGSCSSLLLLPGQALAWQGRKDKAAGSDGPGASAPTVGDAGVREGLRPTQGRHQMGHQLLPPIWKWASEFCWPEYADFLLKRETPNAEPSGLYNSNFRAPVPEFTVKSGGLYLSGFQVITSLLDWGGSHKRIHQGNHSISR